MKIGDYDLIEQFYSDNVPLTDNLQAVIETYPEEKRSELKAILQQASSDKMVYKINNKGDFVGEISLSNYSSATPEMGIELAEQYRGKGIGYLIASAIIEELRNRNIYDYVIYTVYKDNIASVKLVEKLGGILQSKTEIISEIVILTYHIPIVKQIRK